jgi:glycosyltransferase involved in cell wall biosynthesis
MILVLMPAFDEERGLSDLLPRMPTTIGEHAVEVRILDDGSQDATADVALGLGYPVVSTPVNRGKGATLRQALDSLELDRWAAVVLMDADGQHNPDDVPRLVGPIVDETADMVVGSRYCAETGRGCAPWNRYAIRCLAVAILRKAVGIRITDPFSGFRALSPGAVHTIELSGDRYECELEMAFCVGRNRLRIIELPISKVYGEGMTTMGSRNGPLLGRIAVIWSYTRTIVREWRRSSSAPERTLQSAQAL